MVKNKQTKNNPLANSGDIKRCRFNFRVRKIPWKRVWQLIPVFLLENPLGRRATVHRVAKRWTQPKWISTAEQI